MIKVALISHSAAFAGAERMLFNLALLLKESKIYEPIVFIPQSTIQSMTNICRENDILTIQMPYYSQYIYASEENEIEIAKKTLESIESLITLISKNNINIIISNTATSVVPAMVAEILQVPVIGWIHGILDSYLIDSKYDSKKRLFMDRMYIALSDYVICCSEWTTRYYSRFDLSPVSTLYNWTPEPSNVDKFNEESNIFVCLNTFDKQKGIYTLLEASAILKETNSNFCVHLYGDGSMNVKDDMIKFVKENDLSDNVVIMGRTTNTSNVYNSCLCLIQPSYIESFGMTIIEAMSYERPVIAAKAGGPNDIVIDGETGFLIDKDNPALLAEKMKFILENKKVAQTLGYNGKRLYNAKYSSECASKNFEKVLTTTLEQYKGINKNKQLYADSLNILLETLTRGYEKSIKDDTQQIVNKPSRAILSEYLTLPELIKKSKRYSIHSQSSEISEIGVIFTTFSNSESVGYVYMNIYIESKLIRTSKINLKDIVSNQWTYFSFNELRFADRKILTIELSFEYGKVSNIYGIYEDIRNRSLKYKIFNKLGKSEKIVDVLFADCRK